MSLCPEAEMRAAMSDGEFWEHVFGVPSPDYDPEPDELPPSEWDLEHRLAEPCPECGQLGACAYDAEGRSLIHVIEDDE